MNPVRHFVRLKPDPREPWRNSEGVEIGREFADFLKILVEAAGVEREKTRFAYLLTMRLLALTR